MVLNISKPSVNMRSISKPVSITTRSSSGGSSYKPSSQSSRNTNRRYQNQREIERAAAAARKRKQKVKVQKVKLVAKQIALKRKPVARSIPKPIPRPRPITKTNLLKSAPRKTTQIIRAKVSKPASRGKPHGRKIVYRKVAKQRTIRKAPKQYSLIPSIPEAHAIPFGSVAKNVVKGAQRVGSEVGDVGATIQQKAELAKNLVKSRREITGAIKHPFDGSEGFRNSYPNMKSFSRSRPRFGGLRFKSVMVQDQLTNIVGAARDDATRKVMEPRTAKAISKQLPKPPPKQKLTGRAFERTVDLYKGQNAFMSVPRYPSKSLVKAQKRILKADKRGELSYGDEHYGYDVLGVEDYVAGAVGGPPKKVFEAGEKLVRARSPPKAIMEKQWPKTRIDQLIERETIRLNSPKYDYAQKKESARLIKQYKAQKKSGLTNQRRSKQFKQGKKRY